MESSWIFGTILCLWHTFPSQILLFISCLWRHHSLFAFTEHACIYYRIINYPAGCQLKLIHEIQNLLRYFYPYNQFMCYLNFCTLGSLTPFTDFHIFNKDVYPENTTVIEIEKMLMDFTHLVCRHNTLVFILKANMHTVDQLNLATAKCGDFVILNILVTAKNG